MCCDVCATCILLLRLLDLALAVSQLHLLFDGHVSQLPQLGPDVAGDDSLAATGLSHYDPLASCLSDTPVQTEQQHQKSCGTPHSEISPV